MEGGNPDGINPFGIQFNVPIDSTTVTTANVTVTDPSGATIAGTVGLSSTVTFPGAATQEGAPSGNHEIVFQPTAVLKSNTTYTITASNLKLDPTATIPGLGAGAAIPTATGTFTTSDMNAQVYIDNTPNLQLDGLGPTAGYLIWGFTREATAATVTNSSVTLTEINQDGSVGATVPAANLSVAEVPLSAAGATSDLIWGAVVNYCTSSGATSCASTAPAGAAPYLVKCSQNYSLAFATSITDEDDSPVASLTAQACTTGTSCSDVHTFTTAGFAPTVNYTPAAGNVPDTFTVSFPGSLDHNAANALIASTSQPFMQVVDGSGNAVAVTCASLADDTSSSINCTTPALAANASYTVSVVVPSSTACGAGTSSACPLTIAQVATFDTGFQDQNGNEIFDTLPADQVSCSFAGSVITSITTPCAQATATRTPHARKAKKLARVAKPNPNTLD